MSKKNRNHPLRESALRNNQIKPKTSIKKTDVLPPPSGKPKAPPSSQLGEPKKA